MRSRVDLPQPEPPSRQKISPLNIFRLTLLTATKSPKRLVTFSMRPYASACGSRQGSFLDFLSVRRSAVDMADPRCKVRDRSPLPKRRPALGSFAGTEARPGARERAGELRGLGQVRHQLRHHFRG